MSLVLMPSPWALIASRTLAARFSLALRALETALARGLTSCSCIFFKTSLTSGRSLVRSMAMAMACARVMVFLLMWYLLVPRGVWPFALAPLTINILHPCPRPVNDFFPFTFPSQFDHGRLFEHQFDKWIGISRPPSLVMVPRRIPKVKTHHKIFTFCAGTKS